MGDDERARRDAAADMAAEGFPRRYLVGYVRGRTAVVTAASETGLAALLRSGVAEIAVDRDPMP